MNNSATARNSTNKDQMSAGSSARAWNTIDSNCDKIQNPNAVQPSPIEQQKTTTCVSTILASTSLITLTMCAAQLPARTTNMHTTNQNQNTQSSNNSLFPYSTDITAQKRKRDVNVNMTEEVKT